MVQLRDGSNVEDRRLDRLEEFDEASRQYPSTAVLGADQQQPLTRLWDIPEGSEVLDQGTEGACPGFGVTNELRFNPTPIPDLTATFARETIYWGAQKIDPWPGGSYPNARPKYEGSSVLAAIKTAKKLGFYGSYRWAFGEADLALAVSHQGPAVLGLRWMTGMYKPDRNNYLHATGDSVGGHCLLCIGINVEDSYYTLYNSWGPTWGRQGTARISRSDMAKLLRANGEACIPMTRLSPIR